MFVTDAERIAELEDSLTRLSAVLDEYEKRLPRVAELERSVKEYEKLIRLLKEENERLKRGLLGQKAERFSTNDSQLSLAMLQMAFGTEPVAPTDDPEAERIVAEYTRKQPKRKPLPEALLRVGSRCCRSRCRERASTPSSASARTCETVERRPASLVVVRRLQEVRAQGPRRE